MTQAQPINWSVADSVPPVVAACDCGLPLSGWVYSDKALIESVTCACGQKQIQSHLTPIRTHAHFRALAKSQEAQSLEWYFCARNPWYWIVNYVVTQDERWEEAGRPGPYARFPALPYLQSVTQVLWQHTHTAFPKSRQMRLTWLLAAWLLGKAIFVPGRLAMIQSKKAPDSVAVLRRVSGIYHRLKDFAPWMAPSLVNESFSDQGGNMRFGNDCSIIAVPQGAHHVQSHTPSHLVLDEVQLQDEAAEALGQALPACAAITLIGSAEHSWFWRVFLADKQEAA